MTRGFLDDDFYEDLDAELARRGLPVPTNTYSVETSITDEAEVALISLRTISNGATAMTAAQLTVAVRGMARVLIVLVRLQLKRFEGTD